MIRNDRELQLAKLRLDLVTFPRTAPTGLVPSSERRELEQIAESIRREMRDYDRRTLFGIRHAR